MTDAREIIAKWAWGTEASARVNATMALRELSDTGFRILGPDEVDPVTVEKAARLVEEGKEVRDPLDNYQSTIMDEWPSDDEAAAAIRTLGRKA